MYIRLTSDENIYFINYFLGTFFFVMIKHNYSIDEILIAVNELQNKKNKITSNEYRPLEKNISSIPKNTLKLIEEAEKIKK